MPSLGDRYRAGAGRPWHAGIFAPLSGKKIWGAVHSSATSEARHASIPGLLQIRFLE
jgi:hypothetical protein